MVNTSGRGQILSNKPIDWCLPQRRRGRMHLIKSLDRAEKDQPCMLVALTEGLVGGWSSIINRQSSAWQVDMTTQQQRRQREKTTTAVSTVEGRLVL
ncbi:hypothetical protein PoB_002646200 [Plakobranchus ocellatus]|uniref:Uncharacterized protein n=1 Tax=Plakobranchus ocellatus TaxID=259542 RepID=A0AAV3ZZ49_9GAST|nr:hypothetical protein PoB_002646200 [Plakobranchus ocellatus]